MEVGFLAYSGSYRPASGQTRPQEPENTKQHRPAPGSKQELSPSPLSFQGMLKKIEAAGLETDDLLLALVLFLMYRESGDKDLLILLGAMLLS